MAGLFITFEGTEAAGKSTQIGLLASRLRELGWEVVAVREPGGTPIGEEIRHILKASASNHAMTPETEVMLICASRAQLVREVIRPALASGKVVISDRFYDSTLAYQGYGRGLDRNVLDQLIDFAVGETRPDLTLFLRIPLPASELRRATRGESGRDRFEEAARDFFQRVEQGYDVLAQTGGNRIRTVDASGSIETVSRDIWKWVEPFFPKPRKTEPKANGSQP